ncbi:2OG-Fe(II) oxygenase family protein [Caulobacter segnis]|uniref:2OG-Fe(II) oxygenase n=1 Tax=Caulobacter segnis TaxID=88688 RepID=UPI00240F6884|nr:2OG-Fe(II) oxygenase family protein [Caulobacter segnis]MDG2523729.1 2OG-Fe(II) oxygenase family protein [Caulobacter segnis]
MSKPFALREFAGDERAAVVERLERTGRVQIPSVLAGEGAERLLAEARVRTPFQTVTTNSRGHVDLPQAWLDSLTIEQRQEFGQAIHESATERFQYLYDTYPIWDLQQAGKLKGAWRDLLAFLNGESFLGLMRELTGEDRIAMADAQVTRYRRGSFLTGHTDHVDGKDRYYAYVLNLTPAWRIEWGGLLMFHGDDGHVAEAFVPAAGALNLLRVPQPHSVSQVSLSAGDERLSVTGWLRGS